MDEARNTMNLAIEMNVEKRFKKILDPVSLVQTQVDKAYATKIM